MAPALAFLLAVLAAIAAAAAGRHITRPHPLPITQCKAVLHEMSACKHFISARPGSNAAAPSAACCKAFSGEINGDRAIGSCVCYLIDDRNVLSFHVDRWHIASLFSCCTGFDGGAGSVSSFLKNCRGSKAPPHRHPPHDHDHDHDRVPPPHHPPTRDHDVVPLPHCHSRRYHDVPSPSRDADLLPPSPPPRNPDLRQAPPTSSDGDHLRLSPPRRGADTPPPKHLPPGIHYTGLGPTPAAPPRPSMPQPKLNCTGASPIAQPPEPQPKPIWTRPGLEPPIIVIAKGTVEDRWNRVQLLTEGLLFFLL